MEKKTLSILAPAYNEALGIEAFYRQLKEALVPLQDRYDIDFIFVVDKGTDDTLAILKNICREDTSCRVIALSSHFGQQMALLAGIDHAEGDAIVMLDADLQHPPALIPQMVKLWEGGIDVVTTRKKNSYDGWFRQKVTALFYWSISALSSVPIRPHASDFRLISRRVADIFRNQLRERHLFLRGLIAWVGYPSVEIPFEVDPRFRGTSKYSWFSLLKFGWTGILALSVRPLRVVTVVGLIAALFGFTYGLVACAAHFMNDTIPPGWATLAVLLSFFSGLILISIGMLGEYIGAIFTEIKARPHYLVEERVNC